MIRVKIFSDFCNSKVAKEVYEKICDASNLDFYGKDKQVWITEDDDYTHAIIMNKAMPVLKIPKENVVGLAFEPFEYLKLTPEFIQYAQHHIGKYFMGDKTSIETFANLEGGLINIEMKNPNGENNDLKLLKLYPKN